MQSREGTPLGRGRNCLSQSWRLAAQRWRAVGPSQPHTMPQTAITTTSINRCLRLRVCRGSERDSKYEPMASTFTHLVVMRGVLACRSRPHQAIRDHATGERRYSLDVSGRGPSRHPSYPSHLYALALVWDLALGHCTALLEGHTGYVSSVAVTADGRAAVSGAWDKTVRVWDLALGHCTALLEGHTDEVRSVAVTADGRTAVSGSADHTVRVWDLALGRC